MYVCVVCASVFCVYCVCVSSFVNVLLYVMCGVVKSGCGDVCSDCVVFCVVCGEYGAALTYGFKVTTATGVECQDLNKQCGNWRDAGECENNAPYMHLYCKQSCILCAADDTGVCGGGGGGGRWWGVEGGGEG